MMIDLHWARGMLNPTLCGWAPLYEHDQSRRILNRVFKKLAPVDETYVRILNQYQDFLENRGPFQEAVDPILQGAPPHEWWDAMGSEAKLFKPLQDEFSHMYVPYCHVSGIGAFTRSYTIKSTIAFNLVV